MEHRPHSGNLAHIPIIQGLIEGGATREHVCHIGNLAHIPVIQRLIESGAAVEHTLHISDLAQVRSIYSFGKLHVFTARKRQTYPFHCTELLHTQKCFRTMLHTVSHLKRIYALWFHFYQQFAVFSGGKFIGSISTCHGHCRSFQYRTI